MLVQLVDTFVHFKVGKMLLFLELRRLNDSFLAYDPTNLEMHDEARSYNLSSNATVASFPPLGSQLQSIQRS